MSNNTNSNQNPYALYSGQNSDTPNPNLPYPPPPPPPPSYYNIGEYYGQPLPAATPPGAAAYLPSATLYNVPPPQQSAYQITGGPSSSLSFQDDYYYSGAYGSSAEHQRESFASINPQNPPLPNQGSLTLHQQDVPLRSTVISSSLPCDSSQFHQNVPYSAISGNATAQNMCFPSVHGDHSSSIQNVASMSMFNIPPTAHYMETMKQSRFPFPIHYDTLGQAGPSTLGQGVSTLSRSNEINSAKQSGSLGVPSPLLLHAGPALTQQSGKKSRRRPSVSQSTESAPEVSVTTQQSEPPSLYKQNCPPIPMQVKHTLTIPNVPVPSHSIPNLSESLLWQNVSSLQMTNNPCLPHRLSETPQQLCSPNQAYNTSHSASSSADNPAQVLVPPYPPPPITGHTSTFTGKPEVQHDFGPYKAGQSEKPWFQSVQLPTSIEKTQSASVKIKKTEESTRPWTYGSSTQRAKSNEPAKDTSGRDNERPSRPRSRSLSSSDSSARSRSGSRSRSRSHSHSPGSGNLRYRPRRETRNPKRYMRGDRRTRYRKRTSASGKSQRSRSRDARCRSRTPDEPNRSATPDASRPSQPPKRRRRSHSPGGCRTRSPGGCRRSRSSPDELISRRLYGEKRINYDAESKAKEGEIAKPCTIVREEDMLRSNPLSLEEELKEKEKRKEERWDQLRKAESLSESCEIQHRLEGLVQLKPEEIIENEKNIWTRSSPSDLFYTQDESCSRLVKGTPKLKTLTDKFTYELLQRAARQTAERPNYSPPPRKNRMKLAKHKSEVQNSSDSSSGESSTDEESCTMEELERKRMHPYRLHPEMWYNDPGEMNDGPLCRCSAKARRYGIRHGIYAGESHLDKCSLETNNADKLFHYRIMISPPTNFLTKMPTVIKHDEHEFIFEGFSMFSHAPLDELPTCKVIRFNIEYTIIYIEEKYPENFTIRELNLFYNYLFHEILELVDLDFRAYGDDDGCPQFHFMPRFVRELKDNGREILSMNEVMAYLIANSNPLIDEKDLPTLLKMPQFRWQNFADEVKGMVVTNPGMKPCSVRVDQLDRDQPKEGESNYPEIVHFGIRPPQLSYAGNPEYQKSWREYVKFRHLLANMSKPSYDDKRKLESKELKLQEMRTQTKMKRDVTVAVSAKGFHRTGIMCDIVQHAMLIPVLVCHLRFHRSCDILETEIGYKFKNRFLLQLALTHPSYRENFGTNPDHARNSLTNCGIRQPEYGDRRIHYLNTRKRGINTLINIMSRFGKKDETESNITHNERLEFLGDAVVEFLSSIHLFHIFPDLEEGGLATYRAAIVQNQHLAVLAKCLNLEAYMLYAHGSDLCHDLELRHAMANCFEALMGALFLDGGIMAADKVFGETLFKNDSNIIDIWTEYPPHPLQQQEPEGDRKWISSFDFLQRLTRFEKTTGIEFKHIRLLARAFTDRSIGYTNLTLGSNQRLEFLGDTVLQLIASEYLYKHFPEHHEGHLSLLRSSLVNNRTQAVVCDDLGMTEYAVYANPKIELKTKDRADLLEAFLGALYVDQGMEYCQVFCNVCFFPRLQQFIMNQDWNDPKSKLQQCCLTLRTMDGREPDIPVYKVIECKGPTNTRVYTVAVYFRGSRLAKASGHSIQQAEMNAAKKALELSHGLFPQLDHQKRVIAKSLWKQKRPKFPANRERDNDKDRENEAQRMTNSDKSSLKPNTECSSPEQCTSTTSIKESETTEEKSVDNTSSSQGTPSTMKKKKKRNRRKKMTSEALAAPPPVNPNLPNEEEQETACHSV